MEGDRWVKKILKLKKENEMEFLANDNEARR